ncbi:L-ascorbate metabolism protein UlaG (beta-lactamase superfamily) [Actinocorallia herbida]|uniref:L-ascorbate metabolism protein UlaG (Beta-lactamase superfamily) n=1 Tax=Actinocorallia herbida TaxID=58109 RepID=A0A3N1CX37_9ACTN|nr:MBL fold metallo-hydrolase [Actinocorallia herbida]ROO85862.1 L-ascorbate metabolism protein UlaG (beta-lactamase superfamily) [Actinocorallia herbida]
MTDVKFTHIGGPTVLIEVAGVRLLTDPTFDPPGRTYRFGWGTSSRKLTGPALAVADLPPLDAVLLTHDHHADNLDDAGRALLPSAGTVLTTASGARRLGGGAIGLRPGDTHELTVPGRPAITVTATPARHGPPLSRPISGDVIGFALTWPGQANGPLWITGDTVNHGSLRTAARALQPGTVLLHLGAVRFPQTGPLRYTMAAADALSLLDGLAPTTVLPVHYEGWQHFSEGHDTIADTLDGAPSALARPYTWLPLGSPHTVTV